MLHTPFRHFLLFAVLGLCAARAQAPTWAKTTPSDVTAAGNGVQLLGADYGNGIFLLTAYFGGTVTTPAITPAAYTSPDGVTWTKRTLPASSARLGRPRFLNGKFYVGLDGGSGSNGAILSTADGVTWSTSANSVPLLAANDFAYNAGVYVGVASPVSGVSTQIVTSTDGVTWTPRTVTGATFFAGITVFKGKFYAADYVGIFSSADGISWSQVTAAPTGSNLVASNDGTLLVNVTANFSTNTTQHQVLSTDGTSYSAGSAALSTVVEQMRALNGALVTVVPLTSSSTDGTEVKASWDGRTWTTIATTANKYSPKDVAYGAGRYIFVGEFDVFSGTTTVAPGGTAATGGGGSGGTGGGGSLASYVGTYVGKIYVAKNGGAETVFTNFNGTVSASGILSAQGGELTGTVAADGTVTFDRNGMVMTTGTIANGELNALGGPVVLGTTSSVYRIAATGGSTTPTLPAISSQPSGQNVGVGAAVTFSVTVTGSGLSYQWYFNDVAIAGAINALFNLASVTLADAGTYTVKVTNSVGTVTSNAATLLVAPATSAGAYLSNMSIRARAGSGDEALIVGVNIGGAGTSGTKTVLVRGSGPALAAFGLTSAMSDPKLTAYSGSTVIGANDNWVASEAQALSNAVGAFPLTVGSKDAAFVGTGVGAGSYSVVLEGVAGASGIALAEVYDGTPSGSVTSVTPRFINISSRSYVGTGDATLICGFVVAGNGTRRVLVRAVGPGLASFGVGGLLSDPQLTLFSGSTAIATNDNWESSTRATQQSVGAFDLPANSKDAVLIATLSPGSYTVHVTGTTGGTGVALVEVYELP